MPVVQPAWSSTVKTSNNTLNIILQSKGGVGAGNVILFIVQILFGEDFANTMARFVHP
jgi:hypothetical protein